MHHHSAARAVADAEQLMLPATLPPACYLVCLLSLHPPSHCCTCLGSANASTSAARRFSRGQQRAQRLRPGVAAAATGLPVGGVAAAPATAASGPPPCSACTLQRDARSKNTPWAANHATRCNFFFFFTPWGLGRRPFSHTDSNSCRTLPLRARKHTHIVPVPIEHL